MGNGQLRQSATLDKAGMFISRNPGPPGRVESDDEDRDASYSSPFGTTPSLLSFEVHPVGLAFPEELTLRYQQS